MRVSVPQKRCAPPSARNDVLARNPCGQEVGVFPHCPVGCTHPLYASKARAGGRAVPALQTRIVD
jgi:hypothetical protein